MTKTPDELREALKFIHKMEDGEMKNYKALSQLIDEVEVLREVVSTLQGDEIRATDLAEALKKLKGVQGE